MEVIRSKIQRVKGINILSALIALVCFCLCYAFGFAVLVLGSLAMEGPKPWHALSEAGLYGSLVGGIIGLAALIMIYRIGGNDFGKRGLSVISIGWVLWVVIGILSSLYLDVKTLASHSHLAFLLEPALMLAATLTCLLLPAKFLKGDEIQQARPARP